MKFATIYGQILQSWYALDDIGFDKFKKHCYLAMKIEHPGMNDAIYDAIFDKAYSEYGTHFIDVQGTEHSLMTILNLVKHYSKFASTIVHLYNEYYY